MCPCRAFITIFFLALTDVWVLVLGGEGDTSHFRREKNTASTYFILIVRVLSVFCVICTLPHLGFFLFFFFV